MNWDNDFFTRTEALLGSEAMEKLRNTHVAVFGVGGVGSCIIEGLVRSGIGTISVFDGDVVAKSNINRQLIANSKNIAQPKVEAAKERMLAINPFVTIYAERIFLLPENANEIDFSKFSYIADAIDTVSAKILLAEKANSLGIPMISSMGAGNKLDPTRFEVSDIYKTSVCPLAKVMRTELRKRGINSLKCVYSKEEAITPNFKNPEQPNPGKRHTPASIAFVPTVVGFIMAGEIIKDLSKSDLN